MSKKDCIFCKIIRGEIPSYKFYEDKYCIAILDKFPAMDGQSLIISKIHEDYLFDLSESNYVGCLLAAKKAVKAIDKALKTDKTCMVIEGFEVPHAHIKLFPTFDRNLKIHSGKESDGTSLKEYVNKYREAIK